MQTAPKSSEKQKQAFHFKAPEAQSVLLVGDFTHWQERAISMSRGKGGIWTTSVQLEAGRHTYRFIVDGEWRDDPECTLRVPNAFGGQDMVREAA
jgi:1,4-alpha-glucan branching enzyme